MALWFRIYVHYLAEYLYLLSLQTPTYNFIPFILYISYKYMSISISVGAEIGVVAAGPFANIFVFLCLGYIGKAFYKVAGFMLDSISSFIAFYGLVSIFDPLFILLIDLLYGNYNCKRQDHCHDSYTVKLCECYEGDFVKLYNRFVREEGSGVSGIIITVCIYLCSMTVGCLVLYEYMVYVHYDARILDLWRRINASAEEFFIPDDYEVINVIPLNV